MFTSTAEISRVDDLVSRLEQAHRAVAVAQAEEARLLAEAAALADERTRRLVEAGGVRSSADLPARDISAQIALAWRVSDRTVQRRISDAETLHRMFSATAAAWHEGEIDSRHVVVILDAGAELPREVRARFEEHVLRVARSDSAARVASVAGVVAARLDPEGAATRRSVRRAERDVWMRDLGDGVGRLYADTDVTLAHGIMHRLTAMAQEAKRTTPPADASGDGDLTPRSADEPDLGTVRVVTGPRVCDDAMTESAASTAMPPEEPRTMGQLRADIFTDLLLAGAPAAHGPGLGAIVAEVSVTVPVLTLAGRSGEPALLEGTIPIDPDTARTLAGDAVGWDRVLTHPHSGAVLAVDRYRPSADLRRLLRARDERCRFPGCNRRARGCDIDHNHDAALGGETADRNLCHFCRRHHTLKHETAWRVRHLTGGVIEWVSPTCRRYRDRPPAAVRFVADRAPDPPPDRRSRPCDTAPPPF